MRKPQSNIEMITQLMEFSKQGPLMQIFVIDTLTRLSDRIADLTMKSTPS